MTTVEKELNGITLDDVEAILAEDGYEVTQLDGGMLRVRDVESGIALRAVLEENILFLSLTCQVAPKDKITPAVMHNMLAADNGISTSGFQLYDKGDGSVAVTLNNFCKLQTMGEEDRDDILSCVEFLVVDLLAARDLLGDALA